MVRMRDLPATKRESMTIYRCPTFDSTPSVMGGPLSERRVTIISTAGLIKRGDRPVTPRDARYRVLPHAHPPNDVLMSHVSVNFDRIGFQRDPNVVLPRDRLDELEADGIIGAVADEHYSFMGATEAEAFERPVAQLAGRLHQQRVDTALLLPV